MKSQGGRFVGIDLGKRTMEVHFIDAEDRHESWSCLTDGEGRSRLVRKLRAADKVAMEACPLAFILDTLIRKQVGATVHVLNPLGLAMIYKSTKKTDREDAAKLAWVIQRLPAEELPLVVVPTEKEQELRYLVAEQVELTQEHTREINRLHALFVQDGITTITKKDLKDPQSRGKLYGDLTQNLRLRAERYERILLVLEENLEEVEQKIRELVAGHELTPYLMSLPGVGPNLVATFLGYLGTGERFTLKTIASYAGLVPRVDCSGDSNHYGPITKRGCPILRRALVQGAWGLVRTVNGGILQKKYFQWKQTKGNSKALVALARKMIETMWVLATRKALYLDFDPMKYKAKLERYEVKPTGVAGVA